jgi:hypothetical protein
MRALLIAIALTIVTVPTIANAQSCRELRRACEMKDELGEQGRGNCQRYRERCGGGFEGGGRQDRCERLRRACEFKDERGETGQGNCRRYRDECGGGRF